MGKSKGGGKQWQTTPKKTCLGCSVPEPYRSHDWALVPAMPGLQGRIIMNEYIYIYTHIYVGRSGVLPVEIMLLLKKTCNYFGLRKKHLGCHDGCGLMVFNIVLT